METVAFLALLALTLLRLPSAIREPSSRLTWFATITGLGAIFMVGVVVPLPVLDEWIGGSNVVNLAQNLLATTAFWFVMQASRTLDGTRFHRKSLWELPAMLVSFTIPFFLIAERDKTSNDFVKENADQAGLWAYACIYMAWVIVIMVRMLIGIRGREPRPYILIRVGAGAIILASLLEIVYLTLRLVQPGRSTLVELVGDMFVIPFYGGVVLICAGIIVFAIVRASRRSMHATLRRLLKRANVGRGMTLADIPDEDPVHEAYRLAVRLTDIANSQPLTKSERVLLRATAELLDRQMRAPSVVRMSSADPKVAVA
ncbi:hypothetical protein [Microbacterium pumilum]